MSRPFGSRNKKYRTKHTSKCKWCGREFAHVNETTETCGKQCRHRLRHYRDALGLDPDTPKPNTTAAYAVDEFVAALIEAEQLRRRRDQGEQLGTSHPCA
jgi:hypothetical protein